MVGLRAGRARVGLQGPEGRRFLWRNWQRQLGGCPVGGGQAEQGPGELVIVELSSTDWLDVKVTDSSWSSPTPLYRLSCRIGGVAICRRHRSGLLSRRCRNPLRFGHAVL